MGDKKDKNDKSGMGHPASAIPFEATLYNFLPKGWTLMSIIIIGTAYSAWAYQDIVANAEGIDAVQKWAAETQPRVRILEQRQSVMETQLKHMGEKQDRAIDDAKTSRSEIIDALKDLKQDMRRSQ